MKGLIVTVLAALAQAELIMSDLVSEGYTTGGLFKPASCDLGLGINIF